MAVGHRIVEELSQPVSTGGGLIAVSGSVGVAVFDARLLHAAAGPAPRR